MQSILILLQANPFVPFVVLTSKGSRYRVASPKHASVSPNGGRMVVWFDDESAVVIGADQIVALEMEVPQVA